CKAFARRVEVYQGRLDAHRDGPYIPPRPDARGVPIVSRGSFGVRMVYLLPAVFAIVALAPLGSVAYRLIDGSREALKTSQQEYQHLLASTISRELDVYVGGLRAQLTRGSHSLAKVKGGADAVTDDAIRQVLDEVVDERVLYLR